MSQKSELDQLALAIKNELNNTDFQLSIARLLAILVVNGTISGEDILMLKGDLVEDTECKK